MSGKFLNEANSVLKGSQVSYLGTYRALSVLPNKPAPTINLRKKLIKKINFTETYKGFKGILHTSEKSNLNLLEKYFDSSAIIGYIILLELTLETFCANLVSGNIKEGITEVWTLESELSELSEILFYQ